MSENWRDVFLSSDDRILGSILGALEVEARRPHFSVIPEYAFRAPASNEATSNPSAELGVPSSPYSLDRGHVDKADTSIAGLMQREDAPTYDIAAHEFATCEDAVGTHATAPCRAGTCTITMTYIRTPRCSTTGGLPHVMSTDVDSEMLRAVMDLVILLFKEPHCCPGLAQLLIDIFNFHLVHRVAMILIVSPGEIGSNGSLALIEAMMDDPADYVKHVALTPLAGPIQKIKLILPVNYVPEATSEIPSILTSNHVKALWTRMPKKWKDAYLDGSDCLCGSLHATLGPGMIFSMVPRVIISSLDVLDLPVHCLHRVKAGFTSHLC